MGFLGAPSPSLTPPIPGTQHRAWYKGGRRKTVEKVSEGMNAQNVLHTLIHPGKRLYKLKNPTQMSLS